MKRMLILFGLSCILLSCKKEPANNSPVATYDPSVQTDLVDVAYGPNPRHRCNIYLPANRTANTPVLFIIHGGAWVAGSKEDLVNAVPGLRAWLPGYAIVLVNYRLFNAAEASPARFPAQENDVKTCIEYVLGRSGEYVISRKFALWGQSAGGHLAALYAYKYQGNPYSASALIEQVGPTDMLSLYQQLKSEGLKGLLVELMGNPSTSDSALYISSSPLRYVKPSSCPTLILHGDSDEVVPYQQAELLNERLLQLNVPHTYKLYKGEGHTLDGVALEAVNEAITFLNVHMN